MARIHAVGAMSVPLFADDFFSVADPFLNLAAILLGVPGDFQIGVVRRLPNLLFDLPFHFVQLALGPVLRTWFHFYPLPFGELRFAFPRCHSVFAATGSNTSGFIHY